MEKQASKTPKYLYIRKGEDQFLFKYPPGEEVELVCILVDYAENEDIALSWDDVIDVVFEMKTRHDQQIITRSYA